jgi:predicted transcriptional regulator
MLLQAFRNLGLTENEIKIYSALLKLGESTSGQIVKESDLRTGRLYNILESLKNKGFISEITKNNIKYFSPAEPQKFKEYIEKKKEELDGQEKEVDKIMPEIMEMINSKKTKQKIEIYTGLEGLKTAFSKEFPLYKKGATGYVFGVASYKDYEKKVNDFFVNNLMPKRAFSGIKIKRIFSEDAKKDNFYSKKGAETRYLPYQSPVAFNVVGNLVSIGIITAEPLVISIESEEVAKSFIQQFELLWKIAKP